MFIQDAQRSQNFLGLGTCASLANALLLAIKSKPALLISHVAAALLGAGAPRMHPAYYL